MTNEDENLLDTFNTKTNKVKKVIDINDDGIFVDLSDIKVSYSQLGINTVFKFGKYKGLEVRKVLAKDPEYLTWLSSKYKMTQELLDAIKGE